MNEDLRMTWIRGWRWRAALAGLAMVGAVVLHVRWRGSADWGLHFVPGAALCLLLAWMIEGLVAVATSLHRPPREALRWLGTSAPWRGMAWRLAVLATLVGLFYNVEFWRGRRAWAAVEREAERRGDNLSRRGAGMEQVPDEQNLAMAPVFEPLRRVLTARIEYVEDLVHQDLGTLPRVTEWCGNGHGQGRPKQRPMLAPWTMGVEMELDRWLRYWPGDKPPGAKGAPSEPPAPASKAEAAREVLRRLADWDADLAQLRTFASRPYCRFAQDYARQMWGDDQISPVLGGYQRMVVLRAAALLAAGRRDEAYEDTLLALRLLDHSRQQPRAIGGLMRQARQIEALQTVWEGVRARSWSAARLKELQTRIRALDLLADYPMHVRNDAAASADLLEAFIPARRNPGGVPVALRRDPEIQGIYTAIRLLFPSGWSLMDQAAGWSYYFRVTLDRVDLENRRVPSPASGWTVASWGTSDPLFPVFLAPKLRALSEDALTGFPMLQTAADQAELACALERCRLTKGSYPERLDALVPEFIDRVPRDVHTGESLKYRMSDKGFRLYSVGANRVDDGGQTGGRQPGGYFEPTSGDWVWDGGEPALAQGMSR